MEIQARSTWFLTARTSLTGSPSDTLGGLIIGDDFNSHLSRDAEKRGTCGARGLTTPDFGQRMAIERMTQGKHALLLLTSSSLDFSVARGETQHSENGSRPTFSSRTSTPRL